MATTTSFPALIEILTQALSSAAETTARLQAPIPPKDGISLLDIKNELFLSYLQNLVFLILLKLRNRRSNTDGEDDDLDNTVVKKLVELQAYLEKGVRPLEGRLKYQIDKVLRAADDVRRAEDATKAKANGAIVRDEAGDSDEEGGDTKSGNGITPKASEIDDLQYRPNPTAFVRPVAAADSSLRSREDGVYKPPRIQATVMPTTTGPREKEARKPNNSATLDEFISNELSSAPMAEPSIGSTIVSGGRRSKSDKERQEEKERKEYEEGNYVRLPKETKKDRKKKGPKKDAGYGGEEWRGLGEGIDRIDRLTKRKVGDAPRNQLENGRKRLAGDGPRGSGGVEISQGFQKKVKTMGSVRRDRGRKSTQSSKRKTRPIARFSAS